MNATDAARALLREHLRAAGELWLPARGASMHPYLSGDDLLLVRGLRPGQAPSAGEIAVLERAGALVAHFVVSIENGTILTRGSRCDGLAEATVIEDVWGVVVQRRRSRRWWSRLALLPGARLARAAALVVIGRLRAQPFWPRKWSRRMA